MSDVLIKAALARLSWRSQWGGCTEYLASLETGMDVEQCPWKSLVTQRGWILLPEVPKLGFGSHAASAAGAVPGLVCYQLF